MKNVTTAMSGAPLGQMAACGQLGVQWGAATLALLITMVGAAKEAGAGWLQWYYKKGF